MEKLLLQERKNQEAESLALFKAGLRSKADDEWHNCHPQNAANQEYDLTAEPTVTVTVPDSAGGGVLTLGLCTDAPPQDDCDTSDDGHCVGYWKTSDGACYCIGATGSASSMGAQDSLLIYFYGGSIIEGGALSAEIRFGCGGGSSATLKSFESNRFSVQYDTMALCPHFDERFKFPSDSQPATVALCGDSPLFNAFNSECYYPPVVEAYMNVKGWPQTSLHLHVVTFKDGGRQLMSKSNMEKLVDITNHHYAPTGIRFEGSTDVVKSSKYTYGGVDISDFSDWAEIARLVGAEAHQNDRTHVYAVVMNLAESGFAGLCAPPPGQTEFSFGAVCLLDKDLQYAHGTTPAHELGHSLGLLHPFQDTVPSSFHPDPYDCHGDVCFWLMIDESETCDENAHPLPVSANNKQFTLLEVQGSQAWIYVETSSDKRTINKFYLCQQPHMAYCREFDAPTCGASCETLSPTPLRVTTWCRSWPPASMDGACTDPNGCVIRWPIDNPGHAQCRADGEVVPLNSVPDDLTLSCGDMCQESTNGYAYTKYCGPIIKAGDVDVCNGWGEDDQGVPFTHECVPHDNSWLTGDMCKDTPIAPNYQEVSGRVDAANCKLKDDDKPIQQCLDDGQQDFQDIADSSHLIMSYFPDHCHTGFSPGQTARMRCTVDRFYAATDVVRSHESRRMGPVPLYQACMTDDGVRIEWTPPLALLSAEGELQAPRNMMFELKRSPRFNATHLRVAGTAYSAVDPNGRKGDSYRVLVYDDELHGAYIDEMVEVKQDCDKEMECKAPTCEVIQDDKELGPEDSDAMNESDPEDPSSDGGLSPGAQAGIAISVLFVVGAAVVGIWYTRRSKRARVGLDKGAFLSAPERSQA